MSVVKKVKVTNPSTYETTEADIGGSASNISYDNTNNTKIATAENVQAAIDELTENMPNDVTISVESFQDTTKIATVTIGEDDIDLNIPTPLNIVPNPGDNPSQNLNNITIGSTTYHIAGSGGGATSLIDLSDVDSEMTPSDGQVLKYDSANLVWTSSSDIGTTVIANPSGSTGSPTLSGLTVGNDTYSVSTVDEIDDLSNVSIATPANGQVLKYNSTSQKWENANESGGGSSTLAGLTDTTITSPTDGQVLKYDSTTSKWINGSGGSSSVQSLDDLNDVDVSTSTPSSGQILKYNGTTWVNANESSKAGYVDVTGTLTAGQTSITLSDASILTTSTLDFYTDVYGVNPTAVSVSTGSVTLTFATQQSNLGVKVRVSTDSVAGGGNSSLDYYVTGTTTVTDVTE